MRPKRTIPPPFKHQTKSLQFLQTTNRALDASDPGCVSADTEFLTPTGWKRIDQYEPGDQVAQFEPFNRVITWVEPLDYIKLPCDRMVAIAPVRGTSQRLSFEHRVLFYTPDGDHDECSAAEFMERLQRVGAPHNKRKFATTFRPQHNNKFPLSDAEIRLMVAVIADGHFPCGTPRCTMRLKRTRKIERLRELLKNTGFQYTEHPCGGADPEFQVFRFDVPRREKEFTAEWWKCSFKQLLVVADELPHWDGSERKAGSTSFCSTIKASAEFAQYAFAASGHSAHINYSVRANKPDTWNVHAIRNTCFRGPGRPTSVGIVPNPEGFKYCFTTPTSYWLARHNGYIFATGNTGKTRVAIDWSSPSCHLPGEAVLVMAPKSLLQSAWEDDFKKFAPHVRTQVCTAAKREASFAIPADVYITNTDAAVWLAKQPPKFFKRFNRLIIDEGSAYKHPTSQRSRAINKIKRFFEYRLILTGTPNSNTIVDIWNLINILDDGKRLGKSYFHFRSSVCAPVQVGPQPNMLKWEDKPGAEFAVSQLISDIVIRHKFEECIDIPPNYTYSVPFHMPPAQTRAYKQMELQGISLFEKRAITTLNAAGVATKLLQIASGATYSGTTGEEYVSIANERYELIADLIEQRGNCVVFFNWKHQRDGLTKEFENRGITYTVIDGTTAANARKTAVDHFQAGFYKVLLAHPQSAAHGLTLTKGTSTIWASPTYNLEHFIQGNKRIYRAGQTEKTETVVVIAPGTIEEHIFNVLQTKDARQTSMLDLLKDLFSEQ